MFPITKTTLNSVIAKQLNILESAIAEVQEWAKVLWVRFKSGRPRFVSKKVIEVKMTHPETIEKTFYCNPEALRGIRIGDTFKNPDNSAVYKVSEIISEYFVWEKDGVECKQRPSGYSEEKYVVNAIGAFFKTLR